MEELELPIENMAYAGCSVISGRGHGVVTAVGHDTEIGKLLPQYYYDKLSLR